jgi:UDP-GlcNAc:undecaprenyl-phosphate GlcNAc-1-phosphate transferase
VACKRNWLAYPKDDRWHKKPTALYGGVGIFAAFLINALIAYFLYSEQLNRLAFFSLILGASGCFFLGLVDDINKLKPSTKLIGQIIFSSIFIFKGAYFHFSQLQVLNVLFTYFWFIGIINAINLLDNMDGLASGIVLISASILLLLVYQAGYSSQNLFFLIILIFMMSVLGFWIFNRYPATIFMGDTGSLFSGFVLAALTIPSALVPTGHLSNYSPILILVLPVTVLAIPIFDTTLVTIVRALAGRKISQGGKDHLSHRLVVLGFSEKTSVRFLYALALIGGLASVTMTRFHELSVLIFAAYAVFLFILGIYLGKLKVYSVEEKKVVGRKIYAFGTPLCL